MSLNPNTIATAKRLYTAELAKNLFADIGFLSFSKDMSSAINNGQFHWSEAGAVPTVRLNRVAGNTGFGSATQPANRVDVDRFTPVKSFTTDPTKITLVDELVTAYAKDQDVLSDHASALSDRIATHIVYQWMATAAANQVRTTGTARVGAAPGVTTDRKAINYANVLAAVKRLDEMNVPQSGRVMVVPPGLWTDLMNIDEFTQKDYLGFSGMNESPVVQAEFVGTILGLRVFKTPLLRPIVYNNAGTPVPRNPVPNDGDPAFTPAATDNAFALVYHPGFVIRAVSGTKVFMEPDSVMHYGTIMSALAMAAGDTLYADKRGVVSIIESAHP